MEHFRSSHSAQRARSPKLIIPPERRHVHKFIRNWQTDHALRKYVISSREVNPITIRNCSLFHCFELNIVHEEHLFWMQCSFISWYPRHFPALPGFFFWVLPINLRVEFWVIWNKTGSCLQKVDFPPEMRDLSQAIVSRRNFKTFYDK
jgi:hypothetical protein